MTLHPRERELVTRFALGQTRDEIVAGMHIRRKTFYAHRSRVMARAGVGSLVDVLRVIGWLQVPEEPVIAEPIQRVHRPNVTASVRAVA